MAHTLNLFRTVLLTSKQSICSPNIASRCFFGCGFRRREHSTAPKFSNKTPKYNKYGYKNKRTKHTEQKGSEAGLRSPLTDLLSSLNSVEGVLDVASKSRTSVEVSQVLHRIEELCSQDPMPSEEEVYNLLNSDRFQKLGSILGRDAINLSPHILLSSLGCLLTLTPEDVYLIESLETQVLWMLRKWPVSQVYRVLQIHENHCSTDLRRQVYKEAWTFLEQRWVEINSTNMLVSLMYQVDPNSKLMSHLEDRALDLADQLNAKELYRVFYILGRNQRRNSPLLFALAYHLNHQTWVFGPVHLSNLAYACARLNFHDAKLLECITNGILEDVHSPKLVPLIPSILRSLSTLRWLHKGLLDTLTEKLLQDMANVSDSSLHTTFVTCAHLNYIPPAVDTVWPQLVSSLQQASVDDPSRWLEIVWCITVLGKLDSNLASSVLSSNFQEKLKDIPKSQQSVISRRLMNISFSSLHEIQGFEGHSSGPAHLEHKSEVPGSRDLLHDIDEVISNMAPSEKYKKLEVATPAGHVADLVLVVNAKGEPQPIEDFAEPWTPGGNKELPEGYRRVAFQALEYQHMTLCHTQPTGVQEMVARHLRILGFKVVQVPYTAFNKDDTVVKKVQHLQNEINVAIGAKSPSQS